MRQGTVLVTINSGSTVSTDIDLRAGFIAAIAIPGLMTSGDLLIQGSFDASSGSYGRLRDTRAPGSADLRFATGPGSCMIPWPAGMWSPSYAKFETSVAQGQPIQLAVRFRSP